MKNAESFSTSIKVRSSPQQAFEAINDVASWWMGKITGPTRAVGDAFVYRYKTIHRSNQKVTELVPGKKVVWEVTDSNLPSFEDATEWNGTRIEFAITKSGPMTEIRFTHHGLRPSCQCYADCSDGWTFLITNRLKHRITTGKGAEHAA